MDVIEEIQSFFGVYLLVNCNENPKFKGRCYVGFTVDPNRRINQHNRGHKFGGAKTTSRAEGPWVMIMIVHNFPDMTSALRFEWAWQQPKGSKRLKQIESIQKKKRGESTFSYHFRILTELINTGPWNRLGLKIRWFENEYVTQFPQGRFPEQMEICYGAIRIKKPKATQAVTQERLLEDAIQNRTECNLCLSQIENPATDRVFCTNSKCKLVAHIVCLAKLCLNETGHYIPTHGECPICEVKLIWGDVIRRKKGYHVIEEFDDSCEYDI